MNPVGANRNPLAPTANVLALRGLILLSAGNVSAPKENVVGANGFSASTKRNPEVIEGFSTAAEGNSTGTKGNPAAANKFPLAAAGFPRRASLSIQIGNGNFEVLGRAGIGGEAAFQLFGDGDGLERVSADGDEDEVGGGD